MPNITLSVDDETYRAARIYAAQQNATVSGVVRQYLRSLTAAQTPRCAATTCLPRWTRRALSVPATA